MIPGEKTYYEPYRPYDPFGDNNNCKCCGGTGVQKNSKSGFVEHCPCCNGTGKTNAPNKFPVILGQNDKVALCLVTYE